VYLVGSEGSKLDLQTFFICTAQAACRPPLTASLQNRKSVHTMRKVLTTAFFFKIKAFKTKTLHGSRFWKNFCYPTFVNQCSISEDTRFENNHFVSKDFDLYLIAKRTLCFFMVTDMLLQKPSSSWH
jgi:hypothetical protein